MPQSEWLVIEVEITFGLRGCVRRFQIRDQEQEFYFTFVISLFLLHYRQNCLSSNIAFSIAAIVSPGLQA